MKGLILSGGKGTRLYPLTYTRAKQLIPVANKPVLFRVIETIKSAGITEIGIVVGSTAAEVMEAVGDGSQFDVQITYIHQQSPDGLAHAVKISQDFLKKDRFVMFLGDNVIQGGIGTLIKEFASSDWNSQIVLKRVSEPQHFGVAELNEDGSIKMLIEKPQNPPSDLALVGIYMFDENIFDAVHAIKPSARGELEITDAIQWLLDNDLTVHPYVHSGWWIDTGKPLDMLEANSYVLEELEPRVLGSIDMESIVDGRVSIEKGAQIINSTVRGPAIIGENTVIKNAYVGPFTSVYRDVHIENAELERCIVLEEAHIQDVQGRIEDSLIGRKCVVRQETRHPRSIRMNLGDHGRLLLP